MDTLSLPHRSPLPRMVIAAGITVAIGLLSGLSMGNALDTWYARLERPWFAPPNAVFGPVWTMLYILMGSAAGLVWNVGTGYPAVRRALWIYGIQLLLNAAWSFLFFGLRRPAWALAELVVLWAAILLCMFAFARVRRLSAWLLLPYIGWVSFALLLNAAFVQLN